MPLVIESVTETLVGADDSTPTFNMPTTRPNGDLYIAIVSEDGNDGTLATFTGWTIVSANGTTLQSADAGGTGLTIWYRVGSSEPASYTGAGDAEEYVIHVLRISGFDSADNFDVGAVSFSSSDSAAAVAPSPGSPTTANGIVIRVWSIDTDNPTYTSGPTGHTFRGGSSSSAGGTGSIYQGVATRDTLTVIGVDPGTSTMPGTYSDTWIGVSFVVNVAVSAFDAAVTAAFSGVGMLNPSRPRTRVVPY